MISKPLVQIVLPQTGAAEKWYGEDLGRGFRLMGRHLDHVEVFLSDEMAFHPQPEFVTPGGGKHQRWNIDAEVGNLETVANGNVRECRPADQLFIIEIDQIDVEVISAFRIGQAEVQSHLLVLEREGHRLKMGKDTDEALLFGQAVFDDLITDQEGLNAGFDDISHRFIL